MTHRRRQRPGSLRPLLLALLAWGSAVPIQAQLPAYESLPQWSTLAPVADLVRGATIRGWQRGLLDPVPVPGTFWSARNPAGLATEAPHRHGAMDLRTASSAGAYRRPFDSPAVQTAGGRAEGVQPLASGGLWGAVAFNRIGYEPGTNATTLVPYSSVPFVVTDSSVSVNRAIHARLEGAGGWNVGPVDVGIAVGLESLQGHSQHARVPRRHSLVHPAATAGIRWRPSSGGVGVGAHVRGYRQVETGQIPNAGRGTPLITRLNGYSAPQVVLVESGSYFRRREADGTAGGLSVAGPLAGWTLVVFGELGAVSEGQFSLRVADPPTDFWNASSIHGGIAAQRVLGNTLVTAGARAAGLRGDATLTGSDSVIYRGDERHMNLHFDARRSPDDLQSWGYQLRLEIDYENRDRGDTLQHAVRVQIESVDVALTAAVARRLTAGLSMAVEVNHARYSPRGSIPPRDHYPVAARDLLDRETAFLATPRTLNRGALVADLAAPGGVRLRIEGFHERVSRGATSTSLASSPDGTRTSWGISAGARFH